MNKKFYIVTSIPYANGKPHMGHTLDALYGDVLARYYRTIGEDTVLQVGLDENGQKVYQKAQEEKMTVPEWLKKIGPVFLDFEKKLNIGYQIYTKTSDKKNHFPAAQEMWQRAQKNGDIYKKNYKGLYCVGCEAFILKDDLVNCKCPDHQKEPEEIEEENYFFALSKYRGFLKKHFNNNPNFVQPKNYYNEAYNLIDNLKDVSISRPKERLPWGVPVPNDPDHVMYVWFDALINYLSGIGFPSDMKKFNQYWPAEVEIIGKDNNRWHTLLWPAMLKSAGIEDMPKVILIHGHITAKGGVKMSKTIGNVVDPIEVIDKYGTDAFRYYLLSRIPLDNDGAFDKDLFHEVYTADLVNGLGNLLQRTLVMINKYKVKIIESDKGDIFGDTIEKKIKKFDFMDILASIRIMTEVANEQIEEYKPWELAKEGNNHKLGETLNNIHWILSCIAKNIYSFMPETSERIKKQLKTLKPEPLFPRLK